MKRKMIMIIIILSICIGSLFLLEIKNQNKIEIKDNSELWKIIELNRESIYEKMNEISIPGGELEWESLKEIKLEDEITKKKMIDIFYKIRMYIWYQKKLSTGNIEKFFAKI